MADTLTATYDSLDDIPETVDFRDLFTEKGGKFELTGITGIKTGADIDRIQASLTKERDAHKATKTTLGVWAELDHDEVVAKLDKFPELEAAAAGKLDEAAIEEIVNKRVEGTLKSKLSPLERANKKLKEENGELTTTNQGFVVANTRRQIHDSVRTALTGAKVIPEAHEDALMLAERLFEITEEGAIVTRDQVGVAPGLDAASWLGEIQEKKPHWWPGSHGAGARGSGGGGGFQGKNPWTHEGWNMTEQGRLYTEKGQEYANRLAAAAGTTVGGTKPPAKAKA
tara:strand:- start:13920 stop:14771 length:852 start_codon:yes stop_codon:yes gene_type:complete